MAFNPELFRESWSDPFIKEDGSCTWSEWFVLTDAAFKASRSNVRRQLVQATTTFRGSRVRVSAYAKGKDPATMLIVDSENSDLPGMFVHFHDGYSAMMAVRYFNGGVYFDTQNLFDLLQAVGFKDMPDRPGLAVPVLTTLLDALEVDISPYFAGNVAGMAEWVRRNHPVYADSTWPTTK